MKEKGNKLTVDTIENVFNPSIVKKINESLIVNTQKENVICNNSMTMLPPNISKIKLK
jgi:hypothetical protein